jgi:hypothetical protein
VDIERIVGPGFVEILHSRGALLDLVAKREHRACGIFVVDR